MKTPLNTKKTVFIFFKTRNWENKKGFVFQTRSTKEKCTKIFCFSKLFRKIYWIKICLLWIIHYSVWSVELRSSFREWWFCQSQRLQKSESKQWYCNGQSFIVEIVQKKNQLKWSKLFSEASNLFWMYVFAFCILYIRWYFHLLTFPKSHSIDRCLNIRTACFSFSLSKWDVWLIKASIIFNLYFLCVTCTFVSQGVYPKQKWTKRACLMSFAVLLSKQRRFDTTLLKAIVFTIFSTLHHFSCCLYSQYGLKLCNNFRNDFWHNHQKTIC